MRNQETAPRLTVAFASAEEAGQPAEVGWKHRDCAAGRLAAERALHALTGSSVDAVIEPGSNGHMTAQVGGQPVQLCLAQQDGRAASVATQSSLGIGIDLVRVDSVQPAELRFFLTPRERGQRCAYESSVLWALKEAAWKAMACPRGGPFQALELELDDQGCIAAVRYRGVRCCRAGGLIITPPWTDYRAAIVWLIAGAA